jgi:hypothetical protein
MVLLLTNNLYSPASQGDSHAIAKKGLISDSLPDHSFDSYRKTARSINFIYVPAILQLMLLASLEPDQEGREHHPEEIAPAKRPFHQDGQAPAGSGKDSLPWDL